MYRHQEHLPKTYYALVDKFFDAFYDQVSPTTKKPPMDIYNTDSSSNIRIYAPGVNKEEIKIEINDSTMTVSWETEQYSYENQKIVNQEIPFGKFERRVTLPRGTKIEDVNAELTNGILNITIGKPEKEKPKIVVVS
jgi:HSP20 family protein